MIRQQDVLKDVKKSIVRAITATCCVDRWEDGSLRYCLYGDPDTGDLYDCSNEIPSDRVLCVAWYSGPWYVGDKDDRRDWETLENEDFADVICELANRYIEHYGCFGVWKYLAKSSIDIDQRASLAAELERHYGKIEKYGKPRELYVSAYRFCNPRLRLQDVILVGNDECFEGDEFFQYALYKDRLYKAFFDLDVLEEGDNDFGNLDYDHAYKIKDVTCLFLY